MYGDSNSFSLIGCRKTIFIKTFGVGWGGGNGVCVCTILFFCRNFVIQHSKYLNFGTFWVFFILNLGLDGKKSVAHTRYFFFILFYKISKFSYNEKIKLYKQKNCSNTEHNQNQVMIITILH